MTQMAWHRGMGMVHPCRDINKWRFVGNSTSYQLERHWPVLTLRSVNISV